MTFGGILSYLGGNLPKLFVSRLLGATVLGVWNRAESAVLSPFQLLQQALTQAIYPELRRVNGALSQGTREKFADLFLVVAWVTCIPAALLAGLAPWIIPVFLGSGWSDTVPYAVVMAALASITASTSMMSSMLEVADRFSQTYATQLIQIVAVVIGGVWGGLAGSGLIIAWSMVVAMILRHGLNAVFAARQRLLAGNRLLAGYTTVIFAASLVYLLAWLGVQIGFSSGWFTYGYFLALFGVLLLVFLLRKRLPPLLLARRYGLL